VLEVVLPFLPETNQNRGFPISVFVGVIKSLLCLSLSCFGSTFTVFYLLDTSAPPIWSKFCLLAYCHAIDFER